MVIRFLFCTPKSWYKWIGSEIIKLGEGVNAGHFAIEVEMYGDSKIYEAVFPKSRKIALYDWMDHYKVVGEYEFHAPIHLETDIVDFLNDLTGVKYSISQIFTIGLVALFKPLDFILKTKVINQKNALICTEVGSRFVERFMDLRIDQSHDQIGISDMYLYSDMLLEKENVWK